MRRTIWTVAVVALVVAGAFPAQAEELFRARLNGANEVPPVDTITNGRFEMVLNDLETEAEFQLRVNQATRATQAHLHCAPVGVNGPIVVFLAGFHDRGWDIDGNWIGDAVVTDANVIPTSPDVNPTCPDIIGTMSELAASIRAGNIYVNVHTIGNAGGEVRGLVREVN